MTHGGCFIFVAVKAYVSKSVNISFVLVEGIRLL